MAVNPSTPILAADMAALASLANGKTSLPQYINNGNPFTFLSGVGVNGGGVGYKNYDTISIDDGSGLFTSFQAKVIQIGAGGSIVGIRVLSAGVFDPNNTQPASPMNVTGGSGRGASLTFAVNSVSVDGNGYAVRPYAFSDTQLDSLAQNPMWLTELNRLRNNLTFAFGENDVALRVSGPWPLNAGTIFNGYYLDPGGGSSAPTLPNLRSLAFYYADTGNQESVGLDCGASGGSYDPSATTYVSTTINASIKVCGPGTVHLKGGFSFSCQCAQGVPPNGTASSDLPISFSVYGSGPQYSIQGNIDADVAPGTYNFTATVTGGNVFYFPGVSIGDYMTGTNHDVPATVGTRVTLSPGLTNSVAVPGIHNSKSVLKIAIPDAFIGATPFGIQVLNNNSDGTYSWIDSGGTLLSASTSGFLTAIIEPVSSLNPATPAVMPWNLKRSKVAGGGVPAYQYNPMIGLPVVSPGSSPKVFQIGSFDITQPLEFQNDPQSWVASRYFNAGDKIVDSNFNVQQAMAAGQTGASQPAWETTVGSTIQETFVNGNNVTANGVLWQLVSIPTKPIIPVKQRQSATPRYPVYWQSETIAALNPPMTNSDSEKTIWGCGSQWKEHLTGGANGAHDAGWQQDNLALGWWIYSVAINRLGQADNSNGVSFPKPGTVAVTIGCIRNGSFVSFGTWNTGQTIQVLWPIFTSDALVYQCSERVDVQAVAIATNGGGVTTGANVTHPICAAFYNDTQTLLNLIT
jgi:hypothetical protein